MRDAHIERSGCSSCCINIGLCEVGDVARSRVGSTRAHAGTIKAALWRCRDASVITYTGVSYYWVGISKRTSCRYCSRICNMEHLRSIACYKTLQTGVCKGTGYAVLATELFI